MAAFAQQSVNRFLSKGGGVRRPRSQPAPLGRGSLDDRVMRSRLREWVRRSGKSAITGLNKAAKNTAFRAIRKTKKTKISQITRDVGTVAHPKSSAYAIYLHNHPGVDLRGLKTRVARMVAAKRSSIAYIASGWLRALKAFGNTQKDVNPKSVAARGYGKKATSGHKVSEILNTAPGADEVGGVAMEQAAKEGMDDMMNYLDREQQGHAKAFNR